MIINKNELKSFLGNEEGSYYKKFNILKKSKIISNDEVVAKIKTVMDPEIPVNLYDLGLIYNIDIDDNNNVAVKMTLTNPNCPVAATMPENVGKSISSIKGLNSIKVDLIWHPKWSKDMMSEDAKLALDIF